MVWTSVSLAAPSLLVMVRAKSPWTLAPAANSTPLVAARVALIALSVPVSDTVPDPLPVTWPDVRPPVTLVSTVIAPEGTDRVTEKLCRIGLASGSLTCRPVTAMLAPSEPELVETVLTGASLAAVIVRVVVPLLLPPAGTSGVPSSTDQVRVRVVLRP